MPMPVREQLDLDVPRPLEVALEEHGAVAEGGLRLAAGSGACLVELAFGADDAHAAAASSGGGLDEERKADLGGRAVGHDGHAGLARDPLRGELVAAEPERVRRRSDPREPCALDRLGEGGALCEEAVAGVDRFGARLARGPDVLGDVEVRADLDGLVGRARVQRAAIVGRDDGDGGDPELAAGAEDPERDLAPVGDEQLLHGAGS